MNKNYFRQISLTMIKWLFLRVLLIILLDILLRTILTPIYVHYIGIQRKGRSAFKADIVSKNILDLYTIADDSINSWKQDSIAIHIFAWKRQKSLHRLCQSLLDAHYANSSGEIPIFFHVDGGYEPSVAAYVKNFKWPHGKKIVNISDTHLGMPAAIVNAWIPINSASDFEEWAILLEDDVEVAPTFFEYAQYCTVLARYKRRIHGVGMDGMLGCSLYTPIVNEIGPAPNEWSPPFWSAFKEIGSRNPLFNFQLPCSWGSIYNGSMWHIFLEYWRLRELNPDVIPPQLESVSRSTTWHSSWKRALIELMTFRQWSMVYVNIDQKSTSFSTNYFEPGIHSVPAGVEPKIYADSIRSNGDSRFTVPLVKSDIIGTLLPEISDKMIIAIPWVNLSHQLCNPGGRKSLTKMFSVNPELSIFLDSLESKGY